MRALALAMLACVSALAAAEWKIDYSMAKDAQSNADVPVTITIQNTKNEPVSGAEVEAVLTMVEMDHGEFKHAAKQIKAGMYQANVKFVMGGAWQLEVRAKKGSDSAAKKFQFKVKQ